MALAPIFIFVIVVLIICVLITLTRIGQVQFAKSVLNDILKLYEGNVITEVQAKVFLNDMDNPFDTATVFEVKKQLDRIVERELRQIEINKSTDR